MQSLLIVDDQKIVREGIMTLLKELGLQFAQIYQASCSSRAIEIIDRCQPDLILLDIVMPGEDGFSVVRHIRGSGNPAGIIIITSYDEFDYAVKAVKFKINDFLLKPIKKVELYQAIFNAGKSKSGGSPEERLYYYILLGCYMEGKTIDIDADQLYIQTGLKGMADSDLAVLYVCFRAVSGQMQPAFDLLTAGLAKAGLAEIHYPKSEHEFVFILPTPPDRDRLYELTAGILAGHGEYCLGYSETGRLRDLRKLYREACQAGRFAQTNDLANIPVQFGEREMARQAIGNVAGSLGDCLLKGDEAGAIEIVDSLFNYLSIIEENMPVIAGELESLLQSLTHRLAPDLAPSAAPDPEEGSTLLRLKSNVLVRLRELLGVLKHPANIPPQIRKMITYVEANYNKDLSLALAANLFNLNYSHACSLFGRYAGMSFADYLNRLRLEKAADLLRLSAMRVYDIAGKVGFTSEKYFFRKFKEYYNMTPVEYRNRAMPQ